MWEKQSVTEKIVEVHIDELQTIDLAIQNALDTVQQLRTQARAMVATKTAGILAQIDNLALGLHNSNPEKLNEYGIELPKSAQPKPLPVKAVIEDINDDDDGEGFVITIVSQRAVADTYEIQKGIGANANDKTLAPPYPFYKTTKKLTITDDDVLPGTRYFYRVRGINATGAGEWSEPVSRVQ